MHGLSERQYAAHAGLSRGAIQKAKAAERLVLFPDGSIDAAASDARRAETTDPSKIRQPPAPKLKPVPEAAVTAVGDTLREQGLAAPVVGGGTTFLQAKTENEVLKPEESVSSRQLAKKLSIQLFLWRRQQAAFLLQKIDNFIDTLLVAQLREHEGPVAPGGA